MRVPHIFFFIWSQTVAIILNVLSARFHSQVVKYAVLICFQRWCESKCRWNGQKLKGLSQGWQVFASDVKSKVDIDLFQVILARKAIISSDVQHIKMISKHLSEPNYMLGLIIFNMHVVCQCESFKKSYFPQDVLAAHEASTHSDTQRILENQVESEKVPPCWAYTVCPSLVSALTWPIYVYIAIKSTQFGCCLFPLQKSIDKERKIWTIVILISSRNRLTIRNGTFGAQVICITRTQQQRSYANVKQSCDC